MEVMEVMKEKEQRIMELIKQDPFISQQELARQLDVSRSAVAGYISSLTQTGFIKGRAYIVNEKPGMLIIGGANVDRKAILRQTLQMGDSNPGHTEMSRGGVARNIAENLTKMGSEVRLFTAIGADSDGDYLRSHSVNEGIDLQLSIEKSRSSTGNYLAVLDERHDLVLAVADMDIYDTVTAEDMKQMLTKAGTCSWYVADTNLPKEALNEVFHKKEAQPETKLAVIPVSAQKLDRIPDKPEVIDLLILNRLEALALTERWFGIRDTNEEMAIRKLIEHGIRQVIITNGSEGVLLMEAGGEPVAKRAPAADVEDVTGAGDAFSSGVLHGLSRGMTLEEAADTGLATAKLTLESKETVSEWLHEKWMTQFINNRRNET